MKNQPIKKNPLTPPPQSLPSEQWFAARLARAEKRKKFFANLPDYIMAGLMIAMCLSIVLVALYYFIAWVRDIDSLRDRVKSLETRTADVEQCERFHSHLPSWYYMTNTSDNNVILITNAVWYSSGATTNR